MIKDIKNILLFSGGRGSDALYLGLKEYCNKNSIPAKFTLVVNAYDDGLSTGEVRKIIPGGILGPSDLRKIQERQFNYLYNNDYISQFFSFRFIKHDHQQILELLKVSKGVYSDLNALSWIKKLPKSLKTLVEKALAYVDKVYGLQNIKLDNFAFSNLIYAGLAGINDNNLQLVEEEIFKVLNLEDRVILNSIENKYLFALTESGQLLKDEASIVEYSRSSKIYEIYMTDKMISSNHIKKIDSSRDFRKKLKYVINFHLFILKLAVYVEARY